MGLRKALTLGAVMMLAGCTAERHYAWDSLFVFGNPNDPVPVSETANRVLGHHPDVAPLQAQPGNVWPGPVAPMPTLSEVQKYSNMPLGQGYTPSLPSPYPPGEAPGGGADTSPMTPTAAQTSPAAKAKPAATP